MPTKAIFDPEIAKEYYPRLFDPDRAAPLDLTVPHRKTSSLLDTSGAIVNLAARRNKRGATAAFLREAA